MFSLFASLKKSSPLKNLELHTQATRELVNCTSPERVIALQDVQLETAIHEHMHVPVHMASGHISLENTVAALLHSYTLEFEGGFEHGATALQEFLDSFVSWTSDMCTEFNISGFRIENWSHLRSVCSFQPLEPDMIENDHVALDPDDMGARPHGARYSC